MKIFKIMGILAYTAVFALVLIFADKRIQPEENKHLTTNAPTDTVVQHSPKKALHSI